MKRGFAVKGVSVATVAAIALLALGHRATSPFAVIRAANVVTLTQLPPINYPSPIGLDWLSTSNQLLISTYWNTGVPHNFESVDRDTGAHTAWGTQSGWTDEIYFATVRSGQPGGWVEGDVFSAKGSVDVTHVAQFDQNGTLVNGSFATLPAETELKRGGVTFDRYGVPGLDGALVVIASNDVGKGVLPNVWKIDSSGNATKLATLDEHAEGVAVIPNDPQYGPWAGKILYGQEGSGSLGTIDPVTLAVTKMAVGRQVEDIWVIPANSDFYGVDHLEGGDPTTFGKIWTAPASQWTNLVGKVLLAQEHGAHLWTADWNGASFVFDEVNDGSLGPSQNGHQWEHITFAPASSSADANIQLTPATATNRVGDPHVLTAHVNVNSGSGFVNAPANTTINIAILSGPGTLSAPSCQTAGTTGSCTVTLTSTSTGVTTIRASTDVTVGGTPLHRETGDSHTGDSSDATKNWINAKISIVPDATNEVGQSHTFTATLLKDVGDGNGFVAAAGETLTMTLTPSNGATPSPAGPFVLTTNGSGQASVTFSSPSAGLVTGHATSTLSVNGSASFTVATDGVSPNSGDAVKTYVDANIQITPDGTNRVGATHTFTAHVNVNTGSGFSNAPNGTQITFTIDSGPGSFTTAIPCTTAGGTGSCTIGLSSAVVGVTKVSAHTTLSVGGVSLTRNTDGTGANSGPATKTWVNARISITPNATNPVGQPHTFTVTLEKDNGTGSFVPANGEHVDVTLTDANSAVHSAPSGSCTTAGANTDANGQCTITFSSNTPGTVTGHATSTLSVNGSAPFTIATDGIAPDSGDAVKTYVDANIQITPDGTNRVGATHTFTAHVNVNSGTGFASAPDGTQVTFTIDSGPGSFTTASPCTTSGGTGSCTIGLTSAVVGVTKVSAHTTLSVGGVSLTRNTNGTGANSGPATKTWVNARITITPNATNPVGQPHTFTVTLQKDTGTGSFVAAAGEHVDVTLTDTNGAVHTAPTGTCTTAGANTDANGQCSITFSSNTAGTVTGHATSTLSVNGSAPFTIATDGIAPDSGDAVKTYVDANVQITPDGTNQVGATHTFTAHVNVNSGTGFASAPDGTQISFTIDSGPGSFNTPSPCATSGGTGSCTIGLTSAVAGVTKVSAHTTVSVGGVSLTRDTNGTGANSGPATKTWVNARITITPTATNAVGQPHTFTVTLQKDTGTGTFVGASGEHVTVTLTDASGAVHTAATGTCTAAGANTDANGQCTITFSSNTAGTVTGHATSTLSVNGSAPITVATNGVAPNSGDAVKTYVDANIQISPLTATNPISTTHTLTGHVNVNPGTGFVNAADGTTITFSIVSGPGSFVGSPTCTTSGGTGSCTAVITSSVVGTTIVKAATNVTVAGVALHRETNDGLPGDSVNAQKGWYSLPQLRVVKTPDNGTFTVGSQASFTIVVSNPAPVGSQSATHVTLTDTLPTNGGLTWTSATTTQGSCSITGGNALSCSLGTIAPQGSVTITVKSVTTTLPMCTSQPNPAAIATADGGLTAQDSASLSCTSGYVSYTQGGWGAPPNGANVATKLYANFATLYGNNGFVIGGNGGRYTGTWKNKYVNGYLTITNWMPDGGTGGKFIQNYTDAVTTSAGVLATQTAALKLNIDFSAAGIINAGLSSFANLKLTNKQPYLNGYTVAQVLGIANTAIGGGTLPTGITYGILSTLLGQINGNFDPTGGSGFNAGYLTK